MDDKQWYILQTQRAYQLKNTEHILAITLEYNNYVNGKLN